MSSRSGIIILAIVCAIVVGGGGWFTHMTAKKSEKTERTPANSDYYMEHATIYQLDETGHLDYRSKVAKALHFPDDSVDLTDIHVHYHQGTDKYWKLHAKKGHIPPPQKKIYLYDGVVMHHPRKDGSRVTLTAPHAWVYPKKDLVTSTAHVTATEPGQKVTGDGMRAHLDTNKVKLQRNVHTTYVD